MDRHVLQRHLQKALDLPIYNLIQAENRLTIQLQQELSDHPRPHLYIREGTIIFFLFYLEEIPYAVGPIQTLATGTAYFYQDYQIERPDFPLVMRESLETIVSQACLIYTCLAEEELTEDQLLQNSLSSEWDSLVKNHEINRYKFEQTELGIQHYSYEFESQFLRAIKMGDIDYLDSLYKQSIKEQSQLPKIGQLAEAGLKNMEYTVVSMIVLISRAAISGGLEPHIAYELSELYLQKLAKCRNTMEMMSMIWTVQGDFVSKVIDVREEAVRDSYVLKAKVFIDTNIYNPIRVHDVAQAVGLTENYLSRKFSEEMGISISRYIRDEKLDVAADLLTNSSLSVIEVSEYLCFANQSHFGKIFKKKYGLSPVKYAKAHRIADIN